MTAPSGQRFRARFLALCVMSACSLNPGGAGAQAAPPETGALPTPGDTAAAPPGEKPAITEPATVSGDTAKPCCEAPVVQPKKRIVHKRVRRRAHQEPEPVVPEPPPAPPPVPAIRPIGPASVAGLLGKKVVSPNNEDLGRVVDILVNDQSEIRAAVIDFGGFLGVGNRRIAVDWGLLQFRLRENGGGAVTLHLTRRQLQQAPEYKEGSHPDAVLLTEEPPGSVVPLGTLLGAPAPTASPTPGTPPAPAATPVAPPATVPAPAPSPAAPAAAPAAAPVPAPAASPKTAPPGK